MGTPDDRRVRSHEHDSQRPGEMAGQERYLLGRYASSSRPLGSPHSCNFSGCRNTLPTESCLRHIPTDDAPFAYFVEVYKRVSDSDYSQVLRYRGNTRYGDGNPLAVIDSEMPETLRRLGLWKVGDALPVPPRMPQRCVRLVMRKGVEWCQAH